MVFSIARRSQVSIPVLSHFGPEALPSASMALEFRILGSLQVLGGRRADWLGGPKQRSVLAMLLLQANRVVPLERLASDLYDQSVPPTASAQIRDHVSQLRKLLDPGHRPGMAAELIETRQPGYVMHLNPEQLDASRFEWLVAEATGALGRGEFDLASQELRDALALWRGPPLADFTYASFAQPAIGRLEELRLTALERRIEADLALGQDGTLVAELEELVGEYPLREQLRSQLMLRSTERAGRRRRSTSTRRRGGS